MVLSAADGIDTIGNQFIIRAYAISAHVEERVASRHLVTIEKHLLITECIRKNLFPAIYRVFHILLIP